MKKVRPTTKPVRGAPVKGYADGGYVPARGEKPSKIVGPPAKPMKSGKLY